MPHIYEFYFLLTHYVPLFEHVKDKMWHQSAIVETSWPPFVKSEQFSLTWSCGSRQRDTTSSGWKFRLNNLAVKGLTLLKNAKLFNLNFQLHKVVSGWRDPQLHLSEIYSDLTKWRSTILKSCWLVSRFISTCLKADRQCANKKW